MAMIDMVFLYHRKNATVDPLQHCMEGSSTHFGGNAKVGSSLSTRVERAFISWAVPRIPSWVHSYHLTLATLPISAGIVLGSYMARNNTSWLWIVSLLIALQWLTDSLDGSLGRYRKEGLIRWGFYMDHFLDYVFLVSIIFGYAVVLPDQYIFIQLIALIMFSLFMVNSFLEYGATNEFRIAYLGVGPTEIRIVFILVNTLLLIFGKTFLVALLPYILFVSFIGLCVVVTKTSRRVWAMDQAAKRK